MRVGFAGLSGQGFGLIEWARQPHTSAAVSLVTEMARFQFGEDNKVYPKTRHSTGRREARIAEEGLGASADARA